MKLSTTLALAAILGSTALAAQAASLRIGLEADPDMLDPAKSRTFVGRIVFSALCDKLIDVTPDLTLVPQLATGWTVSEDGLAIDLTLREGVKFHDGTDFDAGAVKANIERALTLEDGARKSELASIDSVEVVGPLHARLHLKTPDAPLLAQLADRGGMMLSPASFDTDVAAHPVCSGPFAFRSRVSQDRIELVKFADYWNADAIHLDGVTYLPIPDSTVRLANLQAGDLDLITRLGATDVPTVEGAANLAFASVEGLGYQRLVFNTGNGPHSETPFGQDARLRKAVSLAIDREAINQVVFAGLNAPASQYVPASSPWFDPAFPPQPRDIEAAKALVAEAGFADGVEMELHVSNNPELLQVAQMIQAMVAEAGINANIVSMENATLIATSVKGEFEAEIIAWSGRVDPDGNLYPFVRTGSGNNNSNYSNPALDEVIDAARATSDPDQRRELYHQANVLLNEDAPVLYLYNEAWLYGLSDRVQGFVPSPDGMIRLQGVSLAE